MIEHSMTVHSLTLPVCTVAVGIVHNTRQCIDVLNQLALDQNNYQSATHTIRNISIAVEHQKRVQRVKNWYRSNFGIKRSRIFQRSTYPKSTVMVFGEFN